MCGLCIVRRLLGDYCEDEVDYLDDEVVEVLIQCFGVFVQVYWYELGYGFEFVCVVVGVIELFFIEIGEIDIQGECDELVF